MVAFFILAVSAPGTLAAQQEVVRPDTIMEVIGLKRWTVQMLADSVARYVPGVTLSEAACAIVLRDSVGFAQAAVQTTSFPHRVWQTLSVVEPADRERVDIRTYPDSLPARPEWAAAVEILREHGNALTPMQDFAFRDEIQRVARAAGDSLARWTLEHDRTSDNRAIAAFVLAHFAERESTWWTFMRALRGPSDFANSMARLVLSGMALAQPPKIDWAPVEEDLAYLLGGTNLFAYMDVLRALTATRIEPEVGSRLLTRGADLLLGNLSSENPRRRETVQQFLKQISGEDFGEDVGKWREWIASHGAAPRN